MRVNSMGATEICSPIIYIENPGPNGPWFSSTDPDYHCTNEGKPVPISAPGPKAPNSAPGPKAPNSAPGPKAPNSAPGPKAPNSAPLMAVAAVLGLFLIIPARS